MKKFSKAVLYFTAIAVLSWFLPWLYALAFPSPAGGPFYAFSPVCHKWVASSARPGEKPVISVYDSIPADGSDAQVTHITKQERDSLLPQLFYKELLAHNQLPDTIDGKAVSAHELRSHELMFTSSPRDIVKRQSGMWMMMESMPERVELTDPDHAFRFTPDGRMEFVAMATNSVNNTRSARFTETLRKRGFDFPARDLSANVTSRKQYDEGYLMIDNSGHLFHIKQQAGRPYAAAIAMPGNAKASKAFILEETDRTILGLVTDTDGNAFAIEREGYNVVPLPIGKTDPRKESLMMMGNMFNLTFRITGNDSTRWCAVARGDQNYRHLGTYTYPTPRTTASKAADYIFPYTLTFVSNTDSLAYPRLGRFSAKALWLNAILFILLLGVNFRRKSLAGYCGAVITLGCGIFAFIPFILFRD